MIPSDLAARLRVLTESIVNPVSPIRGVNADLPELPVGQRFTARIESALPDGTFRALVAGRSLTLALPQQAKAGDTLDLVVTARTPRLIIAESGGDVSLSQTRSSAAAHSPTPV
ncbi:MAG: flagellar hook-length control protein FliK, partial [Rhodocyclaceae bacterium]|nr:flagellar hook-length control protein FliK [Rhodocyclaceae bacterium]